MENPYEAPQSDIQLESGILRYERFSTWAVLGLSIITFGIYSIYWFSSRTKTLNEITEDPIPSSFTVAAIVLYVVNILSSFVVALKPELEVISSIINLISSVMIIVWAFKMRNRLEPIMKKSLNGVMVFFFNVYYLNYKINETIDDLEASPES